MLKVYLSIACGGIKGLEGADKIKQEIMTNGPVVLTSFCPSSDALLKNNPILRNQSNFLIVGWDLKEYREVWLVQPLQQTISRTKTDLVHVAMGQFGIDDCCLAQSNSFEDKTWQAGPYYFDISTKGTGPAWQTRWRKMHVTIGSWNELEPLFLEMGSASFSAISQKRTD